MASWLVMSLISARAAETSGSPLVEGMCSATFGVSPVKHGIGRQCTTMSRPAKMQNGIGTKPLLQLIGLWD
jgi:hypothetical protein